MARRVPRTASGALRLTMLGDLAGPFEQAVVLDHLGDHPELVGALRAHPLVLARSAPCAWRSFVGSARASRTISRPETSPMLTCGSKNSPGRRR